MIVSALDGTPISAVAIVDDEAESRQSLGWLLTDAELDCVEIEHALTDLHQAAVEVGSNSQALICDHHLRGTNYAQFDGAELVAHSVKQGFIAVLCTRYAGADIDSIRPFLAHIPVVRRPDELNEPDELWSAFDECRQELLGNVHPQRKVWRTQLVVERLDSDDQTVIVSVPGWALEESIRLRRSDIPPDIQPLIKIGFRCHAYVNLGVENPERLFIKSWVVDG